MDGTKLSDRKPRPADRFLVRPDEFQRENGRRFASDRRYRRRSTSSLLCVAIDSRENRWNGDGEYARANDRTKEASKVRASAAWSLAHGPFSCVRSLTLHAASDVGSLTSPTLLSRGLRKVWGRRGTRREGGGASKRNRKRRRRDGVPKGANGSKGGSSYIFMPRSTRNTHPGGGWNQPPLRFLCRWLGMSTLCALSRGACLPACLPASQSACLPACLLACHVILEVAF